MADQQNPSPEIAGVIDTLPQAGGEPQETRKRTYTKRRRRKAARRTAAAKDAVNLNVPSSDEEPRSRTILTAIANLALLVAVLTIVFAAHRAVQNNKQQTTERAVEQKTTQTAEGAMEQANDQRPQTVDQKQEIQPTEPIELAQPTEPAELAPKAKTEAKQTRSAERFSSDPYTNGGPLDLDRGGGTQTVPTLPSARSHAGSDHKNPWNSGGHMDLDSETNRQQYKKALSLAE